MVIPNQNALSRPWRLANSRGAAFLLVVYFTSLMLFLLGGVSLQRTMTEVRAAQVSRDSLQAFYLAEGALDRAVLALQPSITAIADNPTTPRPVTVPRGAATYTVVTTSPNGQHPITRRITARACISPTSWETTDCMNDSRSVQQQIQADIAEPEAGPAMQGLIGGQRVFLYGPSGALGPNQYMQVYGTVHAGGGTDGIMQLNYAKLNGSISVGASRTDSVDWLWGGYTDLYETNSVPFRPASFFGPSNGVAIQMYPSLTETDHFTSLPTVQATLTPDISDPAYGVRTQDPIDQALQQNHAACTSTIALSGTEQLSISDGHALDIDPAPGKIAVCVTSVSLSGDSRLTFTSPATVYVTGASYSQTGHAALQAVSVGGVTLSNGVEIVLPRWAQSLPSVWGRAGWLALESWSPPSIALAGGTFHGSIWAPYAVVSIHSNRDAGDVLEPVNLFGYITRIYGASTHEVFRFGSSAASTTGGASAKPSLISWSN